MILSAIFGTTIINLVVLFVVVFFCAFGIPGGGVWLVASGAVANTTSELALVMIVGVSAAILGDFSAYLIARKFSFRFQDWLRRFKFYSKNEDEVKTKFNQSEFFILFLSRFLVQGVCAVATYISGFLRLKIRKFLMAIVPGEIIYGTTFPLLGFIFKETWKDYTNVFSDVTALLLLLIVAYFLTRWIIKYYHAKKHSIIQ
jgi:membrane protein DedA with SNARE-associated domain